MSILHVHSMYSKFDSTQSPEEMMIRAKEIGCQNITLTDHGTLLGIPSFMEAGAKYGINAIPGVETYRENRSHFILVAKNYKGYQSISYAMHDANMHIEKTRKNDKLSYPIMTRDIIEKYFTGNDNVIATTACIQSSVNKIILYNHYLKGSLQKEYKKLEEFQSDHDAYQKKNSTLTKVKQDLSDVKKRITECNKYLKTDYRNVLNNKKDKIALLSQESKSYEKLFADIKQREENIRLAEESLPTLEEQKKKLEQKKDQLTPVVAQLKKGYTKYTDADKKIKEKPEKKPEKLYEEAKEELLYLKSIFPNLYVELQYHGLDFEAYAMPILVKLARECNLPIIAANDAHMSAGTEDCIEARRIVRYNYFNKAQTVSDSDRELYLKTDEELIEALSKVIDKNDAEEAVANTNILGECKVEFPEEKHYPSVKNNKTIDELVEEGKQLKISQGLVWNDVYQKRLEHELEVIKKMGYVDYHLVVRDFCYIGRLFGKVPRNKRNEIVEHFGDIEEWIKENNYDCGEGIGPGRGSGAGSLVCYFLGITNIDPIKYNLLFERFLNPERVSMPDIDTDVSNSLRPIVIKYLKWKYGERAVCSIATVTTYQAKNAIQMVGRDLADRKYQDVTNDKENKQLKRTFLHDVTYKISDMIPEDPYITLADCDDDFEMNLNKGAFPNRQEAEEIWKKAKLLEGKLSGTGVHAGGVIISDNDNINDYIPLAWNDEKEVWVAQCDMIQAENNGLLKMDLLGLKTLDVISDTLNMIKQYENISIDIDNIPFEAEVFENIYAQGNTNSVFQFESDGMKNMLKEFKPTCFEDIILLVACYRPGPMQYLESIINIKNGRADLTYKTPELESILSTTYGATVYQEEVMQIFQKLAGYSLGGADLVRRAMSKKKEEKLKIERKAFVYGDEERGIDGCVNRGINESVANTLFDEMMQFAKYAFNKSHAAAYAMVSYQTAWLKYHYPKYFLCAMFNNKEQDEFQPIINDCSLYNVKLLPPDVNFSCFNFINENDDIRYGFKGIKGIGASSQEYVDSIIKNRQTEYYTGIQDFLIKNISCVENPDGLNEYQTFNRDFVTVLIESGCFDSYGFCREDIILPDEVFEKYKTLDDFKLRVIIKDLTFDKKPINKATNIALDIQYLGVIMGGNPLDSYLDESKYMCTPINTITPETTRANIMGFVTGVKRTKSKAGNELMIISLQTKNGECSVLCTGNLCEKYTDDFILYRVVKINISIRGDTYFVQELHLLKAKIDNYYAILDTKDKTMLVRTILNKEVSNRNICIKLSLFWMGKDELYYINKPYVVERFFTEAEAKLMQNRGIDIRRCN